jgi:hypothetical protein
LKLHRPAGDVAGDVDPAAAYPAALFVQAGSYSRADR